MLAILGLFGCSANEVLRVGTPTEDGAEFHNDITSSEVIATFRMMMQEAEEIEAPNGLKDVADVVVFLNRRKEGIAEISEDVWYEEDGTAVLFRDPHYYILGVKQTELLKEMIEAN